MVSLSAYMIMPDAQGALRLSVVVTILALAAFGTIMGRFTGVPMLRRGLHTAVVGGLAAAAAFAIARWIS